MCGFLRRLATALYNSAIHHSGGCHGKYDTFLVHVLIMAGDDSIRQGTNHQGTGQRFSNDGCAQDLIPYNMPTRLRMVTVPSIPESLPLSAAAAWSSEEMAGRPWLTQSS